MPAPALAHALPTRHELPVQLQHYLLAAGAVVALTFLLLAFGARHGDGHRDHPRVELGRSAATRAAAAALRWSLRALGLAAFLIIIAAGLFGTQQPFKNIAPVLVWVVWWVGLAFVCSLLGNVWPHLNPWSTLFAAADRIAGGRIGRAPRRAWPARLGSWPAVCVLLVFAWMELVWTGAERPRALASAILVYSAVTWAGMAVYGREVWLERAEAFTIFFGIVGRFAPISAGGEDPDPAGTLRPHAVGLTARGPQTASRLAFIMLMLAVVTFDGLRETPLWERLAEAALGAPALAPAWQGLLEVGIDPHAALVSAGLLVMPLLFLGAYAATCRISAWAAGRGGHGGRPASTGETMRVFALSLVPIAIAYHFAHYLAYLLLAGQIAIPLLSDPLGLGWNLFGTTLYRFDIGIIDARTVWQVCLVAIVLGHVAAVYLAHRGAVLLHAQRPALAGQAPLAALMVAYTMSSLWILAQPIVVSPQLGMILQSPSPS